MGFRWFVRQQAGELRLDGTVSNLPDGRVEVRAAGPAAALDELERRLRQGPPAARVTALDSTEIDALPERGGFDIVH